ncbi:MAG: PEP-CTERM sorting domain-containing protein, partial [Patescibacteria group bacterium]|nr:PEP-CTERM sorting domain-containing protein [Patescibacteria group bacterium]
MIAGGNSSVNFGNFKLGYIQGRKYKDLNQNGTDDNNEPWLSGWKINLYDSNWQFINSLTTTGSGGLYRFENLDKGTYYTCEELK